MNINNLKYRPALNFKAAYKPTDKEIKLAREILDKNIPNFISKLEASIGNQIPDKICEKDGIKYVKDFTIPEKVKNTFVTFFGMFLDAANKVDSSLLKLGFSETKLYKNYQKSKHIEKEVQAHIGAFETAIQLAHDTYEKNKITDLLNENSEQSLKIKNTFQGLLDETLMDKRANYDTKVERFAARLISGFTAAFFLGNDFYNKSIQKGKTKKEAEKEQHLKQRQEIWENIVEAITQFSIFACFSKFINSKEWAPAVVGTIISLISRVISRKQAGMRITRMKVNDVEIKTHPPSIEEFKNGKRTIEKTPKTVQHKKSVLCIENILKICTLSIGLGYLMRFIKGNQKILNLPFIEDIHSFLEKHKQKVNNKNYKNYIISEQELAKFKEFLNNNEEQDLAQYVNNINFIGDSNGINLGVSHVRKTIFKHIITKQEELYKLKFAPLKMIKDVFYYPYDLVSKIEKAIRKIEPKKINSNNYNIKYSHRRYIDLLNNAENKTQTELAKEYSDYIYNARLDAYNKVTSSKGDNSQIAVLSQFLGTLTGIWFNMNDEFNASIRNGSTKYEAEKDARLRGINKFIRMISQMTISGSLNNIFSKQYNGSVFGAGVIVAISTLLTDTFSRFLTGMPNRKMNKEQLQAYKKHHDEGIMKYYYKAIDKLAS